MAKKSKGRHNATELERVIAAFENAADKDERGEPCDKMYLQVKVTYPENHYRNSLREQAAKLRRELESLNGKRAGGNKAKAQHDKKSEPVMQLLLKLEQDAELNKVARDGKRKHKLHLLLERGFGRSKFMAKNPEQKLKGDQLVEFNKAVAKYRTNPLLDKIAVMSHRTIQNYLDPKKMIALKNKVPKNA